ncbi:MAG TPA: Trp biosynthesis-associated membrane protein, partial [Actinoplanes sp.]|nr:Trp biosynthesis-associated membrane protein [Actinoplanes sp.]
MMTPRRALASCVVGCLAGAGLALYAATRTWSLQVIARPGLSDLRAARTGADEVPRLVGLALVALAGAGALLATRGLVRRLLGGLLAVVGAGGAVWPIACVVGGGLIVFGGVGAARRG